MYKAPECTFFPGKYYRNIYIYIYIYIYYNLTPNLLIIVDQSILSLFLGSSLKEEKIKQWLKSDVKGKIYPVIPYSKVY